MLIGVKNFLEIVNENWTTILVIIGLLITLYQKARAFIIKTDDEKIQIAKDQIKEIILKMVSDAELDFTDWNKAGAIKRSEVISKIYEMYPVLSRAVDQKELISWIDMEINTSLETLKNIIDDNSKEG